MARGMARIVSPVDEFQPMVGINTTPLIDVMLVLLIMFIIVIPSATHKVPVDLPQPGSDPAVPSPVHRLHIDTSGALMWDGRGIGTAELPARLSALKADPAAPVLHLSAAAESRYERFDETIAEVSRAGITRLGFVGNQEFSNFDR